MISREDKIILFEIRLFLKCCPPFLHARDTISVPRFAMEGRGAPGVKSNIEDVEWI